MFGVELLESELPADVLVVAAEDVAHTCSAEVNCCSAMMGASVPEHAVAMRRACGRLRARSIKPTAALKRSAQAAAEE